MKIVGLLLGASVLWFSGVLYGAWSTENMITLNGSAACGQAQTTSKAGTAPGKPGPKTPAD